MRRVALCVAAGVVLAGALMSCGSALFLAPPGSTIGLTANPQFIASDGAVSVITAFVVEPAGTPVADGTIILFFTNLGVVDPQGKTHNGIAKVNFTSDSRSGTAHVTANSAGGGPVSTPSSPSASPTPPPTTGGGGAATAAIDITIGSKNVAAVCCLRADPPRIPTTSSSTHVFARVIDANGNGVANIPVFFTVVAEPSTEFFDVTGPVFTNNNGEAENVMRTKRTTTGTAQVTAAAVGPGSMVTAPANLQIPIL